MIYSEFISGILAEASAIARSNFGKVSGVGKGDDNNQVLTSADLEIGTFLVDQVSLKYPDHNIIDEEKGGIAKGSEFTWVIDPIDGTSNFAAGVPTYGIMIGLLQNDMPVAGGIALPEFFKTYYAEVGCGAFCNDDRIHVTTESTLLYCLVAYGIDGHQENPKLTSDECLLLQNIILGIRNLRTSGSAFDPIMVAEGRYGACLSKTAKIWDVVAPHIIIQEAGGVCTDFYGEKIDYHDPLARATENFTVLAGSPVLHQQLLAIILGSR